MELKILTERRKGLVSKTSHGWLWKIRVIFMEGVPTLPWVHFDELWPHADATMVRKWLRPRSFEAMNQLVYLFGREAFLIVADQ